jgi:prepilin peptidase CpaA
LAVLHVPGLLAFAAILVWAAIGDMRRLIIPDWISVAIAGLFVLHVVTSPIPVNVLGGVAVGAATLAAGLGLFACNLIGGGDVKLMSAIALWAGPMRILDFLFVTAITGGFVAGGMLLRRRHLAPVGGTPGAAASTEVPYGVAISVGGILVAFAIYSGN